MKDKKVGLTVAVDKSTKQIRISEKLHHKLKVEAAIENKSISEIVNQLLIKKYVDGLQEQDKKL